MASSAAGPLEDPDFFAALAAAGYQQAGYPSVSILSTRIDYHTVSLPNAWDPFVRITVSSLPPARDILVTSPGLDPSSWTLKRENRSERGQRGKRAFWLEQEGWFRIEVVFEEEQLEGDVLSGTAFDPIPETLDRQRSLSRPRVRPPSRAGSFYEADINDSPSTDSGSESGAESAGGAQAREERSHETANLSQ
ncbi:hypothetical protein JCM8097_006048 [Rhodosporidiobolus ruineniae]